MSEKYTVWVGGVEVNDAYLNKQDAERLAKWYENADYDDIVVERIEK